MIEWLRGLRRRWRLMWRWIRLTKQQRFDLRVACIVAMADEHIDTVFGSEAMLSLRDKPPDTFMGAVQYIKMLVDMRVITLEVAKGVSKTLIGRTECPITGKWHEARKNHEERKQRIVEHYEKVDRGKSASKRLHGPSEAKP